MGNRFGFNQPGFNAGEQFIESRTFSPDQPYILQLRNDSGDFLYKIEGHTKGEWRETINSAGYLSFTIPLESGYTILPPSYCVSTWLLRRDQTRSKVH